MDAMVSSLCLMRWDVGLREVEVALRPRLMWLPTLRKADPVPIPPPPTTAATHHHYHPGDHRPYSAKARTMDAHTIINLAGIAGGCAVIFVGPSECIWMVCPGSKCRCGWSRHAAPWVWPFDAHSRRPTLSCQTPGLYDFGTALKNSTIQFSFRGPPCHTTSTIARPRGHAGAPTRAPRTTAGFIVALMTCCAVADIAVAVSMMIYGPVNVNVCPVC